MSPLGTNSVPAESHPPLEPPTNPEGINPGSAIASLWLRTSHDPQPTSIPSTLNPLTHCPQCYHALTLPLKPSGVQRCSQCDWVSHDPNQPIFPPT